MSLSLGRCHTNTAKAASPLHCLVHFKYVALNISSYKLGHPNSERNTRMAWNIDNLLKALKDLIILLKCYLKCFMVKAGKTKVTGKRLGEDLQPSSVMERKAQ